MTKKQKKDLETIIYFIPDDFKHIKITKKDINDFFDYSDKGLKRREMKGKFGCNDGFDALIIGKVRRGLHMRMWEEGVLEGTMPYSTILEGLPICIVDFMKKEMFKGRDKNLIDNYKNK